MLLSAFRITGKRLHLKPNRNITFGRKKVDILLQNDESISRLHASISVIPEDFISVFLRKMY